MILILTSLFALGLIGWLGAAALLYQRQGRLLFRCNRRMISNPDGLGLAYQEVTLLSADGTRLGAWWVEPSHRPVVLFCHPNAGNISHMLDTAHCFQELGYSTFLFDYRGYGDSKGEPKKGADTLMDSEAAWDYLVDSGVPAQDILVMGRSIGGPHAAWLGRLHPDCLGVVLENTFADLKQVCREHYRMFPMTGLLVFDYPTAQWAAEISSPVLVAHSEDDDYIAPHHGEQIYAQLQGPRMFLPLKGSHSDAWIQSGPWYCKHLQEFVRMCYKEKS